MAGLLRSWSRWLLPTVIGLVVGLSVWSWNRQPTSTLMAYAPVPPGAQVGLGFTDQRDQRFTTVAGQPCPAWRMHLRINPSLESPGPNWTMFEGDHLGSGYELHWLPERLVLQVIRSPDVVLGSLALPKMPGEVAFVRRGLRVQVWIDGRTRLSCLDPGGMTPLPITWGFRAAGNLGMSNISLYDDRDLLDPAECAALEWLSSPSELPRDIRHNALLMVRYALLAERDHAGQALAWATHAVQRIGTDHPDAAALTTWLRAAAQDPSWAQSAISHSSRDSAGCSRAPSASQAARGTRPKGGSASRATRVAAKDAERSAAGWPWGNALRIAVLACSTFMAAA